MADGKECGKTNFHGLRDLNPMSDITAAGAVARSPRDLSARPPAGKICRCCGCRRWAKAGGRGRRRPARPAAPSFSGRDELEMASNFHSGGLTGAKFNDRNSFVCGKLILFPVLDAATAAKRGGEEAEVLTDYRMVRPVPFSPRSPWADDSEHEIQYCEGSGTLRRWKQRKQKVSHSSIRLKC